MTPVFQPQLEVCDEVGVPSCECFGEIAGELPERTAVPITGFFLQQVSIEDVRSWHMSGGMVGGTVGACRSLRQALVTYGDHTVAVWLLELRYVNDRPLSKRMPHCWPQIPYVMSDRSNRPPYRMRYV